MVCVKIGEPQNCGHVPLHRAKKRGARKTHTYTHLCAGFQVDAGFQGEAGTRPSHARALVTPCIRSHSLNSSLGFLFSRGPIASCRFFFHALPQKPATVAEKGSLAISLLLHMGLCHSKSLNPHEHQGHPHMAVPQKTGAKMEPW